MCRVIFSILLLLATAGARSAPFPGLADAATVQTALHVTAHQRYDLLRRGRNQEIAVILCLPDDTLRDCPMAGRLDQHGPILRTMELEPADGFAVHYRKSKARGSNIQGLPVKTDSSEQVVLLKLHAGGNAPLGVQVFHGTLTYQPMRYGELMPPQKLKLAIPIRVGAHDDPVIEGYWPYHGHAGERSNEAVRTVLSLVVYWWVSTHIGI